MKGLGRLGVGVGLALAILAGHTGTLQARDVKAAQMQLNLILLGYDPGPVDGAPGARTRTALEAFHEANGTVFDGTADDDDLDALYDALAAVPFNGVLPELDATTGRTSQNRAFDFVPEIDLATLYEPVTTLNSDALGALLRDSQLAPAYCRDVPGEALIAPAAQALQTYSSFREFETTGRRKVHPGMGWVDEMAGLARRLGPAAAVGNSEARDVLKRALLDYAAAGAALDTASIMDRNGRVIVTPDFGAGVIATQALLANYLVARDSLGLTGEERQAIETWLTRLYESFPDSMFAISPGLHRITQEVGRVGRAMMLHALMTGAVDQFNLGARTALTAHSFVREDGSERLGAARGNRALFYQGTALMYAMETYVILHSQGADAEAILGPSVRRLADFWGRAWEDHTVLHPYARENEAVFVGADYRVQDIVQVSDGLDLFLAIAPEGESRDRLMAARASYPYRTQIGDVFVSTCIAQTLGDYEPPASEGGGGIGGIESDSVLEIGNARFVQMDEDARFTGYGVNVSGVKLDGAPLNVSRFQMLADWVGPKDRIGNLELLRISYDRSALADAESRAAEFTECGPVASADDQWGQRFRLHFGTEAESNACILGKMGPRDRLFWSTVLVNFEIVLDAAGGETVAETVRALYEHKM